MSPIVRLSSWRQPCLLSCRAAKSGAMTMTATRFRECLEAPAWSLRELARRLNCDSSAVRKMASDGRPIPATLAAWLEMVRAAWSTLSPELCEMARQMKCDDGKFIRYPRGMRPLTDGEAATLEQLAVFHAALPKPVGWQQGRRDGANLPPGQPAAAGTETGTATATAPAIVEDEGEHEEGAGADPGLRHAPAA